MDARERHARAKSIFMEAIDLDAEGRTALVANATKGDPDLKREVESLLKAADETSEADASFPRQPPIAVGVADEVLRDRGHAGGAETLLAAGKRIGSFEITGVIAVGGMGVVYLARQDRPVRDVALKVIRPGLASPSALRRFEHESRVLAMLDHPGVAAVYQAGTSDDGTPFFAMELVTGGRAITEFCESNSIATAQRVELLVAVCEAVHHGHQKGVIHRDLKPANILVMPPAHAAGPARVKVIDFGVARVTDAEVGPSTLDSNLSQFVGTIAYMSPEQCEGDPAKVDVRSDVYALGVVAFETLCGRRPYDLSGTSLLSAPRVIRETAPARLSAVREGLRGDIETVILKALAKDPALRYQSAAAMGDDLRRVMNHEPVQARPPTAVYLAGRFIRRHPVGSALSAAAVVLLAGAAVTSSVLSVRASRARTDAEQQRAVADERSRELASRVYAQQLGLAQAAVAEHNSERALALLEGCEGSSRGWEWRHLRWLADRSEQSLRVGGGIGAGGAGGGRPLRAVLPVDEKTIFTIAEDGQLRRIERSTAGRFEETAHVRAHDGPGTDVKFLPPRAMGEGRNPGGLVLTSGFDGFVRWWDPATLAPAGSWPKVSTMVWALAVADGPDGPDGAVRIAAGDSERQVRFSGSEAAAPPERLGVHTTAMLTVAIARGGSEVWAGGFDGLVRGWEVPSGKVVATIPAHPARCVSMAYTPDGGNAGTIVSGADDGSLVVIDVATRAIRTTAKLSASVSGVAFDRQGHRFVTADRSGAVTMWSSDDWTAGWALAAHSGAGAVAFTPSGRDIVCGGEDGTLKVFDAELGPSVPTLSCAVTELETSALTAAGDRAIVPGDNNDLIIRDTLTFSPRAFVHGDNQYPRTACWSVRGDAIAIGTNRGEVRLVDPLSGEVRAVAPVLAPETVQGVAFDRDGATLLAWSSARAVLCRADTLGEVREIDLGGLVCRGIVRGEAAAGRGALCVVTSGGLRLVDSLTGELAAQQGPASQRSVPGGVSWMAAAKDGDVVALGGPGEVWIVEMRSGQVRAVCRDERGALCCGALSPDGRRLVTGGTDRTLRVWTVGPARPGDGPAPVNSGSLLTIAGAQTPSRMDFTPDGSTLMVTWRDARVTLYETRPVDRSVTRARASNIEAERVVRKMIDRYGVSDDSAAAIAADASLQRDVREAAIRTVRLRSDNAETLNVAAWHAVVRNDRAARVYEVALRQAEVATGLNPANGEMLNTLAAAQVRMGRFEAALATLRRCMPMNSSARGGEPLVADVALLVLARRGLGDLAGAEEARRELGSLVERARAITDPDSLSIAAEALAGPRLAP